MITVLFLLLPSKVLAVATVRASTNNGGAASITINTPTNVNGDLLLWFIAQSITVVQPVPNGWNQIAGLGDGSNTNLFLFDRIANNEPASYTDSVAQVAGMVMISVQNALSNLSTDASATNVGGPSSSPIAPALSSLSTNTDLLITGFDYGDNCTGTCPFSVPSGMTLINNNPFVTTVQFGIGTSSLALGTNSSSAQTASTGSDTSNWATVSIAIASVPQAAGTQGNFIISNVNISPHTKHLSLDLQP